MALTMLVAASDGSNAQTANYNKSSEQGRKPMIRFVSAQQRLLPTARKPKPRNSNDGAAEKSVLPDRRSAAKQQTSKPRATLARYSRSTYKSVLGESAAYSAPHAPPAVLEAHDVPTQYLPASAADETGTSLDSLDHHGACNGCGPCACCGKRCRHCKGCGGFWAKMAAWHAGKHNFTPHIPYRAMPADQYYFRPYNYTDIPEQQGEVLNYGEDPRMPYANRVFDGIYEGLDEEDLSGEEIEGEKAGESPFVPRQQPGATDEPRVPTPPTEANPGAARKSGLPGALPTARRPATVFKAPPVPGSQPKSVFVEPVSLPAPARLPVPAAVPNQQPYVILGGAPRHDGPQVQAIEGSRKQASKVSYRLSDDGVVRLKENPLR